MNESVSYDFLAYFSKATCDAAAPLTAKYLTSNDPRMRAQACAVLGEIGGKENLKKLKILASSDGAYKIDEQVFPPVKVYYVRDACRAAAGKIELRD